MILNKNKTLEFTLEGLKAPNTDDEQSPEYKQYTENYHELTKEINNFLHGAPTLYYSGVNLHGGNFSIGFSNSEDASGLEDNEIGIDFYSNDTRIAFAVADAETVFVLKEKESGLVILQEKEC